MTTFKSTVPGRLSAHEKRLWVEYQTHFIELMKIIKELYGFHTARSDFGLRTVRISKSKTKRR